MGDKYPEEYYNASTNFLEHFRYAKVFLRNSKNSYVTAVPKELIDEISHSTKVSYNAVSKKIVKSGLNMKIKKLRSYYATTMRQYGLLSEEMDLVHGRTGKSIFLVHYFKADPLPLAKKILELLPKLEESCFLSFSIWKLPNFATYEYY